MNVFGRLFRKRYPLISVIIANYNNGDYLEQCINSVLRQTYKSIEIIVCDDASTDSSRCLLKEYSARYENIKVIYNQSNVGVSKARHRAITKAAGRYISTLDSDDYYVDERKLENEMELVGKYRALGKAIIAFSNVDVVDRGGNRISSYQGKQIEEGNLFYPILSRECMIPRDFLLPAKSYFEVGGYDPSLAIYEDWDLKIRLAKKYEFFYTGITGVAYRKTGVGLSCSPSEVHIDAVKKVFYKNLDQISNSQARHDCIMAIERFLVNLANER